MIQLIFLHSFIVIFLLEISILPPNLFKNKTRSFISGSIAQFSKIVFPFALKAANHAFSVAPTEMFGNLILAPLKPLFVSAKIYPSLILIFAPSLFKANK